jgi:hypothetical protein
MFDDDTDAALSDVVHVSSANPSLSSGPLLPRELLELPDLSRTAPRAGRDTDATAAPLRLRTVLGTLAADISCEKVASECESSPSDRNECISPSLLSAWHPTSPFERALATSPFERALATSPFERALATSPFERALATSPFERALATSPFERALATSPLERAEFGGNSGNDNRRCCCIARDVRSGGAKLEDVDESIVAESSSVGFRR